MNDVPKPDNAEPFERMAERINKNIKEPFGGAFVIVPPAGAGAPIESVSFNTGADLAQFWMLLQAQINSALQTPTNPYGRR